MPRIAYGSSAYRRDNGNLPELRLVNMFLERAPQEESGAVLLSRRGLSSALTVGAGPITGAFSQPGVFGGDRFTVSGGTLYRETTAIGAITGDGPVSFAGRASEVLVAAGGDLYSYNGTNLVAVTFPDGAAVTAIEFHDGLFIAARAESHSYYWSAVNDGRSWDGLDFASAESKPDALLDLRVINDTLWLLGENTLEPHANTGDADAPYQRIEQRIFDKGGHSTGCLVEMDNTLLFVGHENMAFRLAEVPERISDHGIEERIAESAEVSAFAFVSEGHSFFCIRLDDGTFAFDLSTSQWCEFASYGRANFRGRCAIRDLALFGDEEDGTLWELSGFDDDGETLERLFTAAFPLKGGSFPVDRLLVENNVGWTALLAGQGSDPTAEIRTSHDAGSTWGNWRSAKLGAQGKFRTKTEWKRLGSFDFPGFMAEVRTTDPVDFRVSGVHINEDGGGRSR
jgi:hypothetical protein